MLPFLSTYDPQTSLEGTLDPLGLTMLAEQLASQMVPTVRERMQRIRFLTAMTVGAVVTEALNPNPRHPESPPFLVWEWLVVESLERGAEKSDGMWGIPGTLVTKRALSKFGYLDYQSYLKTPLIFGFHGVYKRLAEHLRLVDRELRPGNGVASELGRAWAKDNGAGNFDDGNALFQRWTASVKKALLQSPVSTRNVLYPEDCQKIASLFTPHTIGRSEKKVLRDALLAEDPELSLGALRYYWEVFDTSGTDNTDERRVLREVASIAPQYALLVEAIERYENFARTLTNAFDLARYLASRSSTLGLSFAELANERVFVGTAAKLPALYRKAEETMHEIGGKDVAFAERFGCFEEPMKAGDLGAVLFSHHERVQKEKSAAGKNPWFDRVGEDRVIMRRSYVASDLPSALADAFVHYYRSNPLRRFYKDLL